jgi:hypothetical protein
MVDSGVWKPTPAETQKKLAGAGEVRNLSLKSGGAAAAVSFYDGTSVADVIDTNLKWVLDASQQTADNEKFDGLIFRKGVFAVCEQGIGFTPVVCISMVEYTP